jgi:hypothetical protein
VTKEALYKQIGAQPSELPVEFAWLRVSGPGGGDSPGALRELDHYKNAEGFRLATPEDLKRHGYGFPPAARAAEDGTIRRGPDSALFVRSGEVARMWEAFKAKKQADFEGSKPVEFSAGAYSSEVFEEDEEHETLTVKH